MGYYKNLEVAMVVEEPDREPLEPSVEILTRRKLQKNRRETYRTPKHWVVTNFDMALIWCIGPLCAVLGFWVGIAWGADLIG
tara:strand:+ start:887 stop:1132 length:246 start_codon:yes stop_codon:yes gene_type:complete